MKFKGIKQMAAGALAVLAVIPLTVAGSHAEQLKVDGKIPAYSKVQGVSGNLNSIGSDTLNNLMTLWAEGFRKQYPNVNIQIEGKGSSTAPPALIEGTAQIGPMSRDMKKSEIEAFEQKYGFKPVAIGVALDSLAVYVNKDNPIKALSLQEVDAIFSRTRKGGLGQDIETWGQVGLDGSWAAKPVSLYGRNSASGTYGYFKEKALFKGDYKDIVKEQPGSASVVLAVTEDVSGIGYSGIGYKTSGVKAIALSKEQGKEAYEPSYENVLAGKYPLGRMLYLYVAKKPNEPLPKMVEEFLKYALSKEGQEVVIKDGYLPLPAKVVEDQLAKLK
ncbi:MAG: phosphate ABC transporter substrate-binding protein [Syntrophotaleaceae bacterium]